MITWKRDPVRGGYVGSVCGRQVARIVRVGASGWRWSYRGPHQAVATVDEARLLKHAKQAVEGLREAKSTPKKKEHGHEHGLHLKASGGTGERRRATERPRQETDAGQRVGRAAVETAPGGGGDCKRQGPPYSPSIEREPGSDAVRVEGPHLRGQSLEVESTPQTVCDFREGEKPSIAAPRGMVSGEIPEQRLFGSRMKHPAVAAPFSQLSLLGGSDA